VEKAFAILREEVKRGWWDSSLVDELEVLVTESEVPMVGSRTHRER
jgi:hypothetical protein